MHTSALEVFFSHNALYKSTYYITLHQTVKNKLFPKSSPELQIAVNTVADSKIITDAENVNAMRKLSLNSNTGSRHHMTD